MKRIKPPESLSEKTSLTRCDILSFQTEIYEYYKANKRLFPWRETSNPYRILVSEIMLQQTQTDRVIPKYEAFLARFPDFKTLAAAPLAEVITLWQGLGYNRRALALQKTAQEVTVKYNGRLPSTYDQLVSLPGIGPYTAGALMAFAFNQPAVCIETNIRTVYIHKFFQDKTGVTDKELIPFIQATLDHNNPRDWYYALMDYGVWLKKTVGNKSRNSRHYAKQSPLEGSDRQIRGWILKLLVASQSLTESQLLERIPRDPERVRRILSQMMAEGFIRIDNAHYLLS